MLSNFYDLLTQDDELIALVVDHVITNKDSGEDLSGLTSIIVDKASGIIVDIQPGVSTAPKMKTLRFPGCTLLPGFIDCHVHLSIATDDYQIDHLRLSSADKGLRCLKAAQGLLHAGFTTVRSAGDADTFFPSISLAKSINRGDFLGPTIVGAGHYISVTGGGGDINFLSPDNCSCCQVDGVIADGKEEMLRAVRNEVKYGSDWIKLLVTGAFMSASTHAKDSPENTHFSGEELAVVVEEASRRRVPVMAHAHGAEGIALAARLGCRSIEHASFIDEEGIRECLSHHTWIVPTFLVGEYYANAGSSTGAQDRMISLMRDTDAKYEACIRAAVRAGVKVALGSDFVGWDPSITAREFASLVHRAGMSPAAAIKAGTSSAADLLDIPGPPRGRVLVGALADLVIVAGDPLADISLLQSGLRFVMKAGKIVRYDGALQCAPCAPSAPGVSAIEEAKEAV